MKNTFVYYCSIFIPLFLIVGLAQEKKIDDLWFCIFLLIYALIYRAITDYIRLKSKHTLAKKDLWKILITGSRIRYFKALYL